MEIALYIHIPFCRKKCLYCDFYSIAYDPVLADRYLSAVCRRLEACEYSFKTVFIGGGTPSMLSAGQLRLLTGAIDKKRAASCEFTVEVNPDSLDSDKIGSMRDGGVDRFSVGAQSFNDSKLARLGRAHDAAAARAAIISAYRRGVKNISCDLIFGVWDETLRDWKKDLRAAVLLPLKHISAYALTCEAGTPLCRMRDSGAVVLPGGESQAKMYSAALDFLPRHGFKHYEVSNFARTGFLCRHNLEYWDNHSYLGLGPGAVSYLNGVRTRNAARLCDYLKRIRNNKDAVVWKERLSPERRARETAAFKIRTAAGIDRAWFKKNTGFDFGALYGDKIPSLIKKGLVKSPGGGVLALTRKGFLFGDEVSRELV